MESTSKLFDFEIAAKLVMANKEFFERVFGENPEHDIFTVFFGDEPFINCPGSAED